MGGFLIFTQVVFVLLKLIGVFTFSWWWVWSPMLLIIGYYCAAGILTGFGLLVIGIYLLFDELAKNKRRRKYAAELEAKSNKSNWS